jgi:hypothetical protein
MAKASKIRSWLMSNSRSVKFGSLSLGWIPSTTYNLLHATTYRSRLAIICPTTKRALVALERHSHTSTCHRNRLMEALRDEHYHIIGVNSYDEVTIDRFNRSQIIDADC